MKIVVPNLLGAMSANPKLNFRRHVFFTLALFSVAVLAAPAAAQQGTQRSATPEIIFKQVTPDLYFLFDYESSNAGVLVTDEGVLVIDTRQHPRDGQDLLNRIRKITDKPIKWVVNSHFHGDHTYGNSVFKAAGASIVAHRDTARLMQQVAAKEFARRGQFFERRGYDPNEVKLVLPDVTFDNEMTIRLGGKEVRLICLGPGQNPGDTFILFPHARLLYTPGAFGQRSMPNMAFTPSVDSWIKLLGQVAAMDVDKVLPAHGDVATRADLPELAKFLSDEYAAVKNAVAAGVKVEEAVKTLTLPEYKDWRNYNRREQEIRSLYELIGTGRRSYFE